MTPPSPVNIVVCVAQAANPQRPPRLDAATGTIVEGNEPEGFRLDPQSEFALELALRLKKANEGAAVRALTLGAERAERALRMALAAGADSAARVWDAAFEGCDALTAGRPLGTAIGAAGADVILCGSASADFGSSAVGAAIAERLGVPCLAGVRGLTLQPDLKTALAESRKGSRLLTYECALPAVFTVERGRACPPAPPRRILWANREKIAVLDAGALCLAAPDVEHMKPAARVLKFTHPKPRDKRGLGVPPELPAVERYARVMYGGVEQKEGRTVIEGSSPSEAAKLMDWLVDAKFVVGRRVIR